MNPIVLHEAHPRDAHAIAELHATSWRATYAGILSPEFLAGPVEQERLTNWNGRIAAGIPPERYILLAWSGNELAAFICLDLRPDPRWGIMVDNLHVRPSFQGQGLGHRLMAEAARWLEPRWPENGVHLWALEKNQTACRFYDRLGGTLVQRAARKIADGNTVPARRYFWKSPSLLATKDGSDPSRGLFSSHNKD